MPGAEADDAPDAPVAPPAPDAPLTRPVSPPPISSFLHVGHSFTGAQSVPPGQGATWVVNVRIQAVDLKRGTLCGNMEAYVPKPRSPVVTFWEGEIVDNQNFFFKTDKWKAMRAEDMKHWNKFKAFKPYAEHMRLGVDTSLDLSTSRYVFMRWKEQFFLNANADCGLTIAGFYYLCLNRRNGDIVGYYHDPKSLPFQKLELTMCPESRNGYAFANYAFN